MPILTRQQEVVFPQKVWSWPFVFFSDFCSIFTWRVNRDHIENYPWELQENYGAYGKSNKTVCNFFLPNIAFNDNSTILIFEIRGGVESNQTNFKLILIKFFELFFTFRINRIITFRIESNEFRTNPASEKFDFTL